MKLRLQDVMFDFDLSKPRPNIEIVGKTLEEVTAKELLIAIMQSKADLIEADSTMTIEELRDEVDEDD